MQSPQSEYAGASIYNENSTFGPAQGFRNVKITGTIEFNASNNDDEDFAIGIRMESSGAGVGYGDSINYGGAGQGNGGEGYWISFGRDGAQALLSARGDTLAQAEAGCPFIAENSATSFEVNAQGLSLIHI